MSCLTHEHYQRRVGEMEKEHEALARRVRLLQDVADAAREVMKAPLFRGKESTNHKLLMLEQALAALEEKS